MERHSKRRLETPFEAVTHGVIVRVAPKFLGEESEPDLNRFVWAYTVEIENNRSEDIQVRTRHWEIITSSGVRQEVNGRGVVGEEPLIPAGESYRYSSGCPLTSPSGIMRGFYGIETAGRQFRVRIPAFSLDSPHDAARPS